jgi:hypothetical protein
MAFPKTAAAAGLLALICLGTFTAAAGDLSGYVRDQNWFARYQNQPYGVGHYEFAINATGTNAQASLLFGTAATDVFGRFQMNSLPAGIYQVATWDVWWRSAYKFNVVVPASGSAPLLDMRLGAAMWGYPAFWDDQGYHEFGQTFVATGPISMIYLRCPFNTSYSMSVHQQGPGGPQVGVTRTFGGGDQRVVYSYGEMPTAAGNTYYLRVRTASTGIDGVIMQMEPRPDFSDPIPGGCLHLGNAGGLTAHPDRDLGVVIMADDDGLVTNLNTRPSGGTWNVSRVGQTFLARGASLISAAFWLADPSAPSYRVQVYQEGPGGPLVGPPKAGRPARLTADPQMLVIWAPGECALVPGQTYYIEVTRIGGGSFSGVYVNTANPYRDGIAYRDGVPSPGADLAGTFVEEETAGSAERPSVRFLLEPAVHESDRGTNELTVRWRTDVPADSTVEYAHRHPPYKRTVYNPALLTEHAVTLGSLAPHSPYHLRVQSSAAGRRPARSRDMAVCTQPATANLLVNPGFEQGSGASPRAVIPGWTAAGNIDIKVSDGTWFWGVPPRSGNWLLQGAVNGSSSSGHIHQRVPVTPGESYTFSAWATTRHRENNTWKYDVWNDRGRLIFLRLGIDPNGGLNPNSPSVRWTPRSYSHLRYANPAITTTATADHLTVFVAFTGQGGEWHLYGLDDCVLTPAGVPPPELAILRHSTQEGAVFTLHGHPGRGYLIETTTDLDAWSPWKEITATEQPFEIEDPDAAQMVRRYYRARESP